MKKHSADNRRDLSDITENELVSSACLAELQLETLRVVQHNSTAVDDTFHAIKAIEKQNQKLHYPYIYEICLAE